MAAADLHLERTIVVHASPERVLTAFFDARDLAAWWNVLRSVTIPRPLGPYAVEWRSTDIHDDVLGRFGGAFYGTVMDLQAGREFFVADAFWSPPDGDPIGPMALEVRCTPRRESSTTLVSVRQSATDEGRRWRRYFEVTTAAWEQALADLKEYLDNEPLRADG